MVRKNILRRLIAFVAIGVMAIAPQTPAVAAGPVYGPYILATVGFGLPYCLDNPMSTNNHTTMTISECHGGINQQWRNEDLGSAGYWTFSAYSGKCLTVLNALKTNNAAIIQYTCNDGANERWVYDRVPSNTRITLWTTGGREYTTDKIFKIKNVNSSRCITVKNADLFGGNTLLQYDCSSPALNNWAQLLVN